MLVQGSHYRTVRMEHSAQGLVIQVIDQRKLPFGFELMTLVCVDDVADAIRDMVVRGAGCIGVTAAYGMVLAAIEAQGSWDRLRRIGSRLKATRPTAVNLAWAIGRIEAVLEKVPPNRWIERARLEAEAIENEDVAACAAIGQHGLKMIKELRAKQQRAASAVTNILTHCNAGWLAFVDIGSATAPIYAAHDAGIPLHVWVDETRPRNQGARLTAWELAQHGVPHTVIADNAGGHLMQHGQVDLVITGADRVTRTGDAANKIGTYLKALAAADNGVPFYVALPSSTLDWNLRDGLREIPIEERDAREVTHLLGVPSNANAANAGQETEFQVLAASSTAANPAFDVTPARLITGLISERGICPASEEGILAVFPEKR